MNTASPIVLRHSFVVLLAITHLLQTARAGSSTHYTLAPEALDQGGLRGTSTNYSLNPSMMPGGHGVSAAYTLRGGFAGQLADAIATAIELAASPLTVNEGNTRQIAGTLIFDDLSSAPLAASSITWSVQSGPLVSIDVSGLATADMVYQDSAAVVQGAYQSLTATLTLTVQNTLPDNFGSYAADGIDDDWQVQYFGLNNPNAAPAIDADFDGQNNLFEFTAGLSPTDPAARFLLNPMRNQPGQMRLVFSPRLPDRTYTVMTSFNLGAGAVWTALTPSTVSDNGSIRTVTDLNATGTRKFYRVEIVRP